MSDINEWPYPDVEERWKRGDASWREVSDDIYYDQLGVVPPAAMKRNAFAVGEPYTYTRDGAIHSVFTQVCGRYFCRVMPLRDFNADRFVLEIRNQFNI